MNKFVMFFLGVFLLFPSMSYSAEPEDLGVVRAVKRTFTLDFNKCEGKFWGSRSRQVCEVKEIQAGAYDQVVEATTLKVILHDQREDTCRFTVNATKNGYMMTVSIPSKFEHSASQCAIRAFKQLKTNQVIAIVYTVDN